MFRCHDNCVCAIFVLFCFKDHTIIQALKSEHYSVKNEGLYNFIQSNGIIILKFYQLKEL